MRLFSTVAWICGILSVAIIIVGVIALLLSTNPFGIRHEVNYFHVANSLLLLGILCVLAGQGCRQK